MSKWYPKDFQPWSIEPSGTGVIAITRSKDRTRTARLSYSPDKIPRLTVEDERSGIDVEWLNGALAVIEKVVAFDLSFPKSALKATCSNGVLTVEFTLQGIDGKSISTSNWSGVGVDGPRYMWGPFTYVLPRENAEIAVSVASKNCV